MQYLVELCDVLGFIYIHNKKILHNDLKSDNVVLDKEERKEIPYFPILVDFCKASNMSAVPKKQLTESEKKMYKKTFPHCT